MKRDLDLCRQLLADIEGHGPDCSLSSLRPGDADEAIRYHVRLLIDAGFVQEIDRSITTNGAGAVPCLRLTNSGHEFLELAHSDARWREARWVVGQRTGGQSLAVLRAVLTKWAVDAAVHGERWRPRAGRPQFRSAYHRVEPRYRFERDTLAAETPWRRADYSRSEYLGPRSAYLERFDWRDRADRDRFAHEGHYREGMYRDGLAVDPLDREWGDVDEYGVSLPIHVV